MKKGKSRMKSRTNIMRSGVSKSRRKTREQAAYDQHRYDGCDPDASENPPRGASLNDNRER